jgi:hypothetical protein
MYGRSICSIFAITALAVALLPGAAVAQQKSLKDQLVGSWAVTSWQQTYPDGRQDQAFGTNPGGIHIFEANGRFAVIFMRPDLPKIASNDRVKPTADEAMAIAKGVIAYYGTYTVNEADKSVALNLEATTYTNQMATPSQKRIVTSVSADELKYQNPTSTSGGKIEVAFKRIK